MTLMLDKAPGGPTDLMMAYLQNPASMIDKPVNQLAVMDNIIYPLVIGWSGLLSFGMFVLGGR